ncbi:MAG TPA: hypothetical protein VEL07_09290 [Planctomycetota bacterium]|nr:hypothetical protein [Planctomycetota bacterium]
MAQRIDPACLEAAEILTTTDHVSLSRRTCPSRLQPAAGAPATRAGRWATPALAPTLAALSLESPLPSTMASLGASELVIAYREQRCPIDKLVLELRGVVPDPQDREDQRESGYRRQWVTGWRSFDVYTRRGASSNHATIEISKDDERPFIRVSFSPSVVLYGDNSRLAEVSEGQLARMITSLTRDLFPRTTKNGYKRKRLWRVHTIDLTVDYFGDVPAYHRAYRLARSPRVRHPTKRYENGNLSFRPRRGSAGYGVSFYDKVLEMQARGVRAPDGLSVGMLGRIELRLRGQRCLSWLVPALERSAVGKGVAFQRKGGGYDWCTLDYTRLHQFLRREVMALEGRHRPRTRAMRKGYALSVRMAVEHPPFLGLFTHAQRERIRQDAFEASLAAARLSRLSDVCWPHWVGKLPLSVRKRRRGARQAPVNPTMCGSRSRPQDTDWRVCPHVRGDMRGDSVPQQAVESTH